MRTFLITLLAGVSCASLWADFSYEATTRVEGARNPIVTKRLFKGNRTGIAGKGRTTVIDLDKETVTEIDFVKKTYAVRMFAQTKPAVDADFKVSAKATGQTRNVGVLPTKELVLTMTREDAFDISVDAWIAVVPGYDEVREFQRKLGEKIGYAYGSDLLQLAAERPEILEGLAEAAKEINKVQGVPLQSTMKMASLVETATQLTSFSSAPVDASKLDVPAGFKQVQP